MLRCIQRLETDPYYNIAAEEFLFKNSDSDTFMTWRNEPSVIIGKHQVASREINHFFVESQKLPVIRRITGGGAVYHDLGNINFSFIYSDRKENPVDFIFFTKPIILFLRKWGLNATFEGKNNISVDGLKISGNSAHIYKNKVLHHGTLLFNTDLESLAKSVKGSEEHYKDKSVRSVRAEIANISSLLKEKLSVEEFMSSFGKFIFTTFPGSYHDDLNSIEKESIARLVEEKYKKLAWNYGYSPEYWFDDAWKTEDGDFAISLFVKEGMIREAKISGPGSCSLVLEKLADQMTGVFHEKKSVLESLKKLTFASGIEDQILKQILQHLF